MSGGKASAAALLLCAVLAGCGGTSTDGKGIGGEPIEAFTAEQIFGRAEYELNRRKFERAAEYFGEVERLYPYSAWAKRALIMQAFAHHKDKDYENSRSAAQRYIDFYPTDADAAYAQYLLALSFYDQI
ncbi:MAG: outer membrane protein assembly factor BamD, partial [Pseudomonadota bacterium]|nr:outer membrane protein assembly factor BamD [Pseudomonadota bacterium]